MDILVEKTTLLQLKSLSLNHETEASLDVKEAIKNTVLGNPDGIRYQHLDSMKKIDEIKPLHFFTLRKQNHLLYVMAIDERITYLSKVPYNTYNVRYVSFNQKFAAQDLRSNDRAKKMQRLQNTFIKEGMRKYADTFPFSLQEKNADQKKRIYQAYVEESNYVQEISQNFFLIL